MTMRYLALTLVTALLFAACGDDEVPAPETPTASPAATASPAPSVTGSPLGLPVLTLAPAVALPPNIALLLETGCFQCDAPATGLIRVSRTADGVSERDLLLSAGTHVLYGEEAGPPEFFAGDLPIPRETIETEKGSEQYDPYVTGIAASADGAEIVVSVCVYPGCGVGKDNDVTFPPGRAALYRSTDGGQTWSDFGSIEGGTVLGIVSPGTVLAMSPAGTDGPPEVFLYPSRGPVARAPTTQGVFQPPVVLADGAIAWPDWGGALVRPDGSVILRLPEVPGVSGPYTIGSAVQQGFRDRLIAVYWFAASEAPFLSLFDSDGAHIRTVSLGRYIIGDGWAWASVSDSALIANIEISAEELDLATPEFYPGVLPALIDLSSGTIHPITSPFLDPGAECGRNFIRGVQLGSSSP